jgi:LacI family transcriptional regulator
LLRIAQTREVDGILLLGEVPTLDMIIERLLSTRMPFVIVSRKVDHPEVNFVTPDNWDGARLAVHHLGALGHRRIGHVAFVEGSRYSRERFNGYCAGLAELGLPYDESLVVNASLAPGSGAQAIATLLQLAAPPTAVYVYNDRLAIEGLQYLRQRGVRVPQDLSIVGFDDIRSSGMTSPALTTIHQPLDRIAEAAVAALLSAHAQPVRLVVPVELVVRQSSMTMSELSDVPQRSFEA